MTQTIEFTKMHGLGNDYIYVNTQKYPIAEPEKLSVTLSAPHTGIGSDGLVLIGDSKVADFSMHIYNADGSEAMMCGNASRCIGKYVYEKGLTRKSFVTLETLSGIKTLDLSIENDKVNEVKTDMGLPVVLNKDLKLDIEGKEYVGIEVSMGNPHFVIEVTDIDEVELSKIGPLIENHPYFLDRTNVEFVQIYNPDEVRMRVWERGSGITQACGTGACATAVACITAGKTDKKVKVVMDGGSLFIEWSPGKHLYMTGEATSVFEGRIEIED